MQTSSVLNGCILFAAVCLSATVADGGALLRQDVAPGAVTVAPNDKNLLYVGRWDRREPDVAHSHWGGAYLRTRFTGASVGLKMADGEQLVVSIDGEPVRAVVGKPGITMLNAAPLTSGLHTLLVGPSTGGEAKVLGLVLDPGAVTKLAVARPLIEFIGDSITWGTGPKDLWSVNYAWLAAEALHCDHTQVAQSARALTTGYGARTKRREWISSISC